jgi:hypothetical protein
MSVIIGPNSVVGKLPLVRVLGCSIAVVLLDGITWVVFKDLPLGTAFIEFPTFVVRAKILRTDVANKRSEVWNNFILS